MDYLGVSILEEGLSLRKEKIKKPILVFTPLLPFQWETAIENNLTLTIYDFQNIEELNKIAYRRKKKVNIHLKVDVGMGRLGLAPEEAMKIVKKIFVLPNLYLEGLYTHLGYLYDEDKLEIGNRFEKFQNIVKNLVKEKIFIPLKHVANSSVFLDFPPMHADMIRIGNLTYGFVPFSRRNQLDLNNPWKFKSRVIQIKKIRKGSWIGYGQEYRLCKDTKVAVIPVGFFEGLSALPLSIKNKTTQNDVEIKGCKFPLIGRVSMQLSVIDLGHAANIQVGDEVSLNLRRTSANVLVPRIYQYKGKTYTE